MGRFTHGLSRRAPTLVAMVVILILTRYVKFWMAVQSMFDPRGLGSLFLRLSSEPFTS